jgi:hypothetical protein
MLTELTILRNRSSIESLLPSRDKAKKQASMITYQNASRYPAAFHSLFGHSVADFDALYAEFAIAYEHRVAESALTRKQATPRKRKPGAGRRFKHPLRERLLLTLFWLRVYPTLELLGVCFSLDKTSAEDNLKDVLATLSTLAGFAFDTPDRRRRKLHTLEQVLTAFPAVALIMDDADQQTSEQPDKPPEPPSTNRSESSEETDDGTPEVRRLLFRPGVEQQIGQETNCPTNLLYRAMPAFYKATPEMHKRLLYPLASSDKKGEVDTI